MKKEDGGDEGEREDDNDERIAVYVFTGQFGYNFTEQRSTHILSPGESSVYRRNMVLELPPAPAARDELGLATLEPVARRLHDFDMDQTFKFDAGSRMESELRYQTGLSECSMMRDRGLAHRT